MSFNTRSTSNITYSKTRSSLSARRSAEKTDALLKSSKISTVLGSKKSQRKTEKKSYSLRNAKCNTKSKLETIQHAPEQTSSKRKETATKRSSPQKVLIILSDNSNDSSEVDFKKQTDKVEIGNVVDEDVVIVSSDDEDHDVDKHSSQLSAAEDVCNADVAAGNDSLKEVGKDGSELSFENTSVVAETEAESLNPELIENEVKKLAKLEDSTSTSNADPTVQPDINAIDNISELSKVDNFVPAVSPQAVSLLKTSNEEKFEHPNQETDDQNQEKITSNTSPTADTESKINENEIQSDLMSKKVEPESFEFCKQINDNASLTSPNISERPVSSNSRSTTSTSSIILRDNDLYSPGSTDLSMSEDSRGSFIESGSEKTVQRRSRGRIKRTSATKSSGQTKSYTENVSSSCSPSEDGSMEPPSKRNKRLPSRVGITWEIGHRLEAVDHNEWYPAKIVEVDKDACEVLIHFEGWSARFDEWVPMDSPKLRPTSSPNLKNETKEKKSTNQQYKSNEKILARWNDGKLYDATVTEAHSEGYYVVVFYDGFTKKLPVSAMRKLNDPTVKKRRLQLLNSPQKGNLGRMPSQPRAVKGKNTDSVHVSARRSSSSLDTSPLKTNVSPGTASKQFVVECDHNQFKCTFEGCGKEFRKETLLQSHLKHYHNCDKGSSDVSGRSSPVRPKKVRSRMKSSSISSDIERPKNSPLIMEEDVPCGPVKCELEPTKIQDDEKMLIQITTPTVVANSLTESKEEIMPTTPTLQAPHSLLPTTILQDDLPLLATTTTGLISPGVIDESETSAKSAEIKVEPASVTKAVKSSPRKEIYPVTKMETRHAKPCLFRDDSIYTGYISYRSLYTKGSRGGRKSVDAEPKRGRHGKTEDDKTFPETKKRRRRLSHKTEPNKRKLDYPDIDDEIAEMKRRRVDRVSESSVKTDENTWDSVDYDENEEDDETVSDQQEVNSDELVRCICENEEENGLMFQCEECKTWQHAACFNIENEEDVPDKYFCYMCSKPKSQQVEGPVVEEDSWFTTGVLPMFSFLEEKSPVSRPNAVLATHELINSTTKILSVLKGLQHKIQIAGSDNHSDLRHWSKPWKQHGAVKPHSKKPELMIASPSIASQSATDAGDYLVFDHAYFSQSDSAIGLQEEVVTEQPEMSTNSIDISLSVNPNLRLPDVKQRRPAQMTQESRERTNPRRRGGGREGGRGRGRWRDAHHLNVPPVEEVIDVGTCKNNLIGHIHSVQDNMDQELNLLESQLNLLEAEMDNSGWTGHSDSAPVLKSLKSLSKDLDVVQRFTLL